MSANHVAPKIFFVPIANLNFALRAKFPCWKKLRNKYQWYSSRIGISGECFVQHCVINSVTLIAKIWSFVEIYQKNSPKHLTNTGFQKN